MNYGGYIALPSNTFTTINTLTLNAGSYLFTARLNLRSTGPVTFQCYLFAGTTTSSAVIDNIYMSDITGYFTTDVLIGAATLTATTTITTQCYVSIGPSYQADVQRANLAAQQVSAIH